MTGCPLALVADDHRLATALQAHLQQALGREVFHATFADVRAHLARDGGGLLLLAAATPPDADQLLRLVQEVYLQKLPLVLLVVEGEGLGRGRGLSQLDARVAGRLRWPDDAARLAQCVRQRAGPAGAFAPGSARQVFARRLALLTPSLLPLVERLAVAAAHDVTVLLTGETGTGKTWLARLLHDGSPRAGEPFVVVSCGALTAGLAESTFFGHVKGAFTGATENKAGKFEVAGGGTLLLDEIDTLGPEQQAGLLRVVETGEF